MKKMMVLMMVLMVAAAAQANLITNPGFEDGDLGQLGSVIIPGWTAWGTSGWHHDDAGYKFDGKGIKLWWDATGVYQDITVDELTEYTVSAQAITAASDALKGWDAVVKIEWFDSASAFISSQEVGRFIGEKDSKGIPGNPADTWALLSSTLTSPQNAAAGRVVFYLEQADNWESTTGGSVYLDNFSVVPEPATLALLSLGTLLSLKRRK